MRILFWNTNNNASLNPIIADLVCENNVDLLVLAEYGASGDELLTILSERGLLFVESFTAKKTRIRLFYCNQRVDPSRENNYYTLNIVEDEYILCALHSVSKRENETSERCAIARKTMRMINEVKQEYHLDKVVIVGDFNESPYEESCISADCFFGLPELNGRFDFRTVNGDKYEKYYNPMWNKMGDFQFPPGTYYLERGHGIIDSEWHMLDQFIISKSVVPYFKQDSLKIITQVADLKLYKKSGRPNKDKYSDHFPIFCEIGDKKKGH